MSPRVFNDNDNPDYQLWSERDFRADFDVQALDWLQTFIYRTLCQVAWVCPTRPYLPNDDAQLWRLAGCKDREQWEANKTTVRALFNVTTKDGKLIGRKRIVNDWNRLVAKRQAQRAGGAIGGKKSAQLKATETKGDGPQGNLQGNLELTLKFPQGSKVKSGQQRKVESSTALVKPRTATAPDKPKALNSSSLDLTVTENLGQGPTLERMVSFMSDGEFQTSALKAYAEKDELKSACCKALLTVADTVVRDRLQCRIIMERVNDELLAQYIKPPGGWVPAIKVLKRGGPLQLQPVEHTCMECGSNYVGLKCKHQDCPTNTTDSAFATRVLEAS